MKKITSKREIKKFLRKHINLRNNYLLVLMVLSISFLVIYSSYALFVVSKTKMGAYNITAGTINVELTSEALDTNKQITVNANDSQEFEVTLTNKSSVPAKVILYYKMINPTSPSEDIMVGYKTDTAFPPISTGSILSSSGLSDDHSSYTLIIKNDSSESTTIEIGVKVGLSSPALTLANDEYLISQAISLDDKTLVEGNASDWEVSTEQNATGGYTLLAFTGDLENSNSVIVDQDYYTDANISLYYLGFTGVSDTSEMTNLNAYTINIPNVVAGKNITELGPTLMSGVDFANYDLEAEGEPPFIEPRLRIKGVNIPEGIKKISEASDSEEPTGTFVYDFNLSEVNLPSTVTEIGNYVFAGTALSQVTIPKTVTVIGRMAFIHFGTLQNITFEGAGDRTSELVNIMSSAFENMGDKNDSAPDYVLTIPASVTTIGENTFDNNNIGTLTFKGALDGTSQLKTIGYAAFYANHITQLVIPSSVEMIDSQAFGKNALTSLVFAGTSTDGSGNDSSHLTTLGSDIGTTFNVDNVTSIIYLPASLINMEHTFSCDYRDSLCTFYINHPSIPETYYSWAGNYARKYILNGSGGYTCVENCPN